MLSLYEISKIERYQVFMSSLQYTHVMCAMYLCVSIIIMYHGIQHKNYYKTRYIFKFLKLRLNGCHHDESDNNSLFDYYQRPVIQVQVYKFIQVINE